MEEKKERKEEKYWTAREKRIQLKKGGLLDVAYFNYD